MSSPYLRCVETASSICQRLGSRTRLMVDLGLGEVYGPEIFGEKPEKAIRSCREIEEHLRTVYGTTVLPVSTVGVWPTWPETLALARRRFAERLLVYISRGAKARRNFLLVSHADCVDDSNQSSWMARSNLARAYELPSFAQVAAAWHGAVTTAVSV